jgi:adenylate kinase family enzyme
VAFLSPGDELAYRPARILVAGTSGSGKTTLARRIAAMLEIPHVELDGLYHGANWTPRPEFVRDVEQLVVRDRWVTEWQYHEVRRLLGDRADLLVVLDLARWRIMARITRRTLSRRLRRTELWNGNREPPLRTFLNDPDHIIRFAWRTHARTLPRVTELMERAPSLPVVRLLTPAEVDRWLAGPLTRAAANSRYRGAS